MAKSKVGICNISLAMLGAEEIRTFDEDNKRARMCDVFYDVVREYLLSRFDWPFARVFAKLKMLDQDAYPAPDGCVSFQLPTNCLTPRDIHPVGGKTKWEIAGDKLYVSYELAGDGTDEDTVGLYYTSNEDNPGLFSSTFAMLLSTTLAVKICPAITQDDKLTTVLMGQAENETKNAWESDANIGNDYRAFNEDPNNDTFVYPDGHLVDEDKYIYG